MHLIVLQHGFGGKSSHMAFIEKTLRERFNSTEAVILNCGSNSWLKSFDGVDVCGDRVFQAIIRKIEEYGGRINKISLIGYSMGGLIVRYTAGKLYSEGIFERVEPVNLITFATPHLGARKPEVGRIQKIFNKAMPLIGARAGAQMGLTDDFRNGQQLLLIMSDPGLTFAKAASAFRRRCVYANILNDRTVNFTTAAITGSNPFRKNQMEIPNSNYPSLVAPVQNLPVTTLEKPSKVQGVIFGSLVALFSPFILTFYLVLGVFTVSHNRKWKHKSHQHISWIPVSPQTDGAKERLGVDECRNAILRNLSQIEWDRFFVKTKHWHGHAAIVVRNSLKGGSEDVPRHLVDTFVL